MLKAFDDLERAVGILVEKSRKDKTDVSVKKVAKEVSDNIVSNLETVHGDADSREAAELVRRAIKRLRSL